MIPVEEQIKIQEVMNRINAMLAKDYFLLTLEGEELRIKQYKLLDGHVFEISIDDIYSNIYGITYLKDFVNYFEGTRFVPKNLKRVIDEIKDKK